MRRKRNPEVLPPAEILRISRLDFGHDEPLIHAKMNSCRVELRPLGLGLVYELQIFEVVFDEFECEIALKLV